MTQTATKTARAMAWLFQRSRLARTAFVFAVWPPTYIADRLRGAVEGWRSSDPPSWRRGMEWARNGDGRRQPTIPTSDTPAVIGRRPRT